MIRFLGRNVKELKFEGRRVALIKYEGQVVYRLEPDGPPPAELTELSSTLFRVDTTSLNPWNHTVSIPSGNNRLLLDFTGVQSPGTNYTCVLDPDGDNIALTQDSNSPSFFPPSGDEWVILHVLKEADFPNTTGNKTLRIGPWTASRPGRRRVVILENAAQTYFTAANNHDADAALTLSITRPSGSFPAGSKVYAAVYHEQGMGLFTVTGDLTVVDNEIVSHATTSLRDTWCFATTTLAQPKATLSATFTPQNSGVRRAQGIIAVVEPAA